WAAGPGSRGGSGTGAHVIEQTDHARLADRAVGDPHGGSTYDEAGTDYKRLLAAQGERDEDVGGRAGRGTACRTVGGRGDLRRAGRGGGAGGGNRCWLSPWRHSRHAEEDRSVHRRVRHVPRSC